MTERSTRRAYLDWLRGLAVLFTIEAHGLNAWTRAAATIVVALLTPAARTTAWLAFPPAGAAVGLLIDATRDGRRERLVMACLALGGAAMWVASHTRSLAPGLFDDPATWTAYWIHVEMVDGLVSYPLHRALPLLWSWIALGILSVLLYRLVRLKNRLVPAWRARRPPNSIVGRVADAVLG